MELASEPNYHYDDVAVSHFPQPGMQFSGAHQGAGSNPPKGPHEPVLLQHKSAGQRSEKMGPQRLSVVSGVLAFCDNGSKISVEITKGWMETSHRTALVESELQVVEPCRTSKA